MTTVHPQTNIFTNTTGSTRHSQNSWTTVFTDCILASDDSTDVYKVSSSVGGAYHINVLIAVIYQRH